MQYQASEIVYILNLVFTVAYSSAMLIYIGRHDNRGPVIRALQRLILGVVSWALYDVLITRIGQVASPELAFFLFRFLSIMWLVIVGLTAEMAVSLIRPVTPKLRLLLFTPSIAMWILHIAAPELTSGRVYGIPGGYSGFPAPWHKVYSIVWMSMFLYIGLRLFYSIRREPDPDTKREKATLLIGLLISMVLIALSRILLQIFGPGFPALGNTATVVFSLSAYIGIRKFGRVLSPQMLYRITVDNIPNGLVHVHQGRITWANNTMTAMTGVFPTDELIGREIEKIFRFTSNPPLPLTIPGNRQTTVWEAELHKEQKSSFLVAATLFDPAKPEQGALFVFTDITAQKEAENALKESEAKFYTAFRSNPSAITISRIADGKYIEINHGFEELYGHSREEAMGRTAADLNIWADHPEQEENRRRLLDEKGAVRDFEFTFRRKNGDTGTALNFAEIIKLNNQPHLLSISFDISDRKKAEEDLKKSEERYKAVIDASADPIVVYDIRGLCMYANPAFTRVFGWTLPEIEGRRIDYVPADVAEESEKRSRQIVDGESFYGFETVRLTKDGKRVDILMSAAVFKDRQGRMEGNVINLQDITERKTAEKEKERLQAQLRQSQKMEAIGQLASGVAHDFNNILQAISGSISLITLDSSPGSKVAKHAGRIETAVERAKDLVQRLLTFSRKVEPELKSLNLNEAVDDALSILERTIPRMIRIEKRFEPDIQTINADSNQVYQALMNLVTNARDAMPDGGKLIIETQNVTIDENNSPPHLPIVPGRYVLLRVADTGGGMNQEVSKNLFNPFFTTKEVGKGTGLGLSTVYGIVQKHGGYIDFDGTPGQGASFNIYWPSVEGGLESDPLCDNEDSPETGEGEMILLVDDEPNLVEIASEFLSGYGYAVAKADSGESAIDYYEKNGNTVDLIIMDLGMPGMGGYKALGELLRIDPGVKVLIASGYSADKGSGDPRTTGAAGFIGKPYRLSELLTKVREVLESERP